MWKSLFCVALFIRTAHGSYWLSKSDPICRDETFLYYWQATDGPKQGANPFEITNCSVQLQTWFFISMTVIFLGWLTQVIPAIVNFIEGPERLMAYCPDHVAAEEK